MAVLLLVKLFIKGVQPQRGTGGIGVPGTFVGNVGVVDVVEAERNVENDII